MSDRVALTCTFTCNGRTVEVAAEPGETLLSVLRERLRLLSVKDGCAPQGQCGCCTVLVDGEPRVACVTPVARVADRTVTTIEGLEPGVRDSLAASFVATGGSQCGFCTPGILMRFAGARARDADRALAAHLCRCTGWVTVREAVARAGDRAEVGAVGDARDLDAAAARAALEGGTAQSVGLDVPLGGAPFADDTAPADALVAVPLPPGSDAAFVEAAGARWVVGETLYEARAAAGKVQGRRTTFTEQPPLIAYVPELPDGGVRLATSWVEPAYLEPDASWCQPGGVPATPLANGGAFGGKVASLAPAAARELADRLGRSVRVVYSREDVVRLGPKRPPIAASAVARNSVVHIEGVVARGGSTRVWPVPDGIEVGASWREVDVAGPPVSTEIRAAGLAEQAVLVAAALDRDIDVVTPSGARASAQVDMRNGLIERVSVRLAAGDPLDDTVLRSYAIGAAHMALGWVCTESVAVDPDSGEVHDLTMRSFGVIRAKDVPPIDVEIVADDAPPRARSSDAVFAAVAAATWNAIARAEGQRPDTFPARETRAARRLRR
jgi:aerobic-type carbon monoxide dehydrogenase small subunit (CoxS/CutS family)